MRCQAKSWRSFIDMTPQCLLRGAMKAIWSRSLFIMRIRCLTYFSLASQNTVKSEGWQQKSVLLKCDRKFPRKQIWLRVLGLPRIKWGHRNPSHCNNKLICDRCSRRCIIPTFLLLMVNAEDNAGIDLFRQGDNLSSRQIGLDLTGEQNKPNGQFLLPFEPEAIKEFMQDLSIRKIQGIGRVNERLLESIGIKVGNRSFCFLLSSW